MPIRVAAFARDSLAASSFSVSVSEVDASEKAKSLETAGRLLGELLSGKHERADPVVSLGGGIVTDIAGFVAATYRRGVPVIHCPTTLLAMVDAAVGGKTGVNLELPGGTLVKNMAGAFWQPHLVICDPETLESLPSRHLRAGMAECLKHGLISAGLPDRQGRDDQLWEWTLGNLDACLKRDAKALTGIIARNIRVKAGVVSGDEREEAPSMQGGRALLNLGHTFAHAIETLPTLSPDGNPGSSPLQHGEAVAYGLIAAAAASHDMGWISEESVAQVRLAVSKLGLAPRLFGLPDDDTLIERMSHDKKAAAGNLRLVLMQRIGEARVVENPPFEVVKAGWQAIRAD